MLYDLYERNYGQDEARCDAHVREIWDRTNNLTITW